MASNSTDAIALLKEDHDNVKDLFEQFEETHSSVEKAKLVKEAVAALKVHAAVEEQLFYPALRQSIDDEDGIMEEADEEHHVAKILIAELEAMNGDEPNWDAKVMVLAEIIRHHIKEEEGTMFKKARETDVDFDALGSEMLDLKMALTTEGVPDDFETEMVQTSGLRGESPAAKAAANFAVPWKRKAA